MEPAARPRPGGGPANAIVLGVSLLIPLAVSPILAEPFTSPKWYLLELAAVCWFVLERFRYGSHGWPSFLRLTRVVAVPFVAFTVLQSLLLGLDWAVPALLARASFLLLALSSFWYFRRNHLRTTALEAGVTIAAAAVITMGSLQFAGLWPLPWWPGGDPCSATFGNVNMAAQFAGLAVARTAVPAWRQRRCAVRPGRRLHDGSPRRRRVRLRVFGSDAVGRPGAGCRAALLASVRRLPPARLLRAAAGAVVLVLLVSARRDGRSRTGWGGASSAGKARTPWGCASPSGATPST